MVVTHSPSKKEERGLRREPKEKVEEFASIFTNKNYHLAPSIHTRDVTKQVSLYLSTWITTCD
jgi:hypothetical protein